MSEREIYDSLERASIRLSDALTGGGVFAVHGSEPVDILHRAHRMDTQIIDALTALNLALRELDKRRKDHRP